MGHVAIVTGGTRGIGEAISVALRDAGHTVAAIYAGNAEAAKRFGERTGIRTYKFDVSDYEACRDAVDRIAKDLGPIGILVNNAGITRDATMHRMSFDRWNAVLQTNLSSCFNMSRCVIEGMREQRLRPHREHRLGQRPGRPVRAGQLRGGQVRHPRLHQGARPGGAPREGITVNAIAPGYIDTDMVRAVPEKVLEKIIATIPGRAARAMRARSPRR